MLVDYEYSCYAYAGFDIGNHFCEWSANYDSPEPHKLDFSKYPTKVTFFFFLYSFFFILFSFFYFFFISLFLYFFISLFIFCFFLLFFVVFCFYLFIFFFDLIFYFIKNPILSFWQTLADIGIN